MATMVELNYDILIKVFGGIAGIYLMLSLFNVHWLTRIRVLAAMLVGVVLVGWIGWPLVSPEDPLGAVTLVDSEITFKTGAMLALLGFAAGLIAYWIGYPKGSMAAPLAAPAGMAAWVFASGDMRTLLLTNSTLVERRKVFAVLCWEGLFWLIPVFAGLLGTAAGFWLQNRKKQLSIEPLSEANKPIQLAFSVLASVAIAKIIISIIAQDVTQPDPQLGQVIGQPGKGQIALAVFVSFMAAGYVVKYFMKIGYVIPSVCAAVVVYVAMRYALAPDILEQMTRNWSVAYFAKPICSILPLQMVTFGALGAFTGFQIAVKTEETHQSVK